MKQLYFLGPQALIQRQTEATEELQVNFFQSLKLMGLAVAGGLEAITTSRAQVLCCFQHVVVCY